MADVTREQAPEAALRKLVNSIWMDGKGADNIVNRAAYDAARATLSALAMPPAQGEFTRVWEAGRDAAAAECDRMRESYRRSLSLYPEDDPQHRLVKYSGATAAVCAENIRALTPPAMPPAQGVDASRAVILSDIEQALPRWIEAMGDWDAGGEQAIDEMEATLDDIRALAALRAKMAEGEE
jgi:hypothetical protein